MNLTLKVWRQEDRDSEGRIEVYPVENIPPEASFLEMLDIVNEQIITEGGSPIHFDHDCREGICGMCSLTINGIPHGAEKATTTCQLHMRHFSDGDTIWIEPFRAGAFPVIRDLVVDRSAFDRIIEAGGFISVRTGAAPDANALPVPKEDSDRAFDSATCIGCGACVAACKNSSAMLFVSAKASHLNQLPQGKPEKDRRSLRMVEAMDEAGFGNCSNHYECEAVCPKSIPADNIAKLNRDYATAVTRKALS
ncbi:MAG: succinate dehydrogenase [Verrucomicrobiaceae bacterium]|jgi:succinate dehydrogenase / fumarate reductase iron-sulfur subunit|nr:succinate dehydrogenase [Verrucomicrobiaceae bacterium]MBB07871.1 succinate dehydrogenase [Roseibacillus sp.]